MRSAAALLGLFAIGSLAFTACDGDDDTIGGGGSSGQAGKGGKGGSAGKGGSNAGKGAESGTAGDTGGTGATGGSNATGGSSSGKGGSGAQGGSGAKGGSNATGGTTDGTAGDSASGASGSAGDDGTGGSTNGTGGTAGTSGTAGLSGVGGSIGASGAGAGGEAGSTGGEAGGGGSGPVPTPKACTYECQLDDDCDPGHNYTCVDGLCLNAERACTSHDGCIPWATGLTETCAQDTDCYYFADFGDLCINVAGGGYCVSVPFEGDCAFGAPTVADKFELSDTATVCLDLSGRCDAHQCTKGCTSDANFCTTSPNNKRGPECNHDTGKCGGCTGDGQCGGPGTSHCNVATGTCGCVADDDCNGLAGMDTCIDGKCSCSASSCTAFPDATPICG
jgi:hypothetical protein